jgi:FkbM family methyltransferase
MPRMPSSFSDLVQRLSAKLGYTLLPTAHVAHRPQAEYLRRLFREFRITGVVDVGANAGQYHDFIREQTGFTGPMVSVEPIPALARANMARAATEAHWTVEELALGPAQGTSTFLVTAGTEFSSFLEPLESTKGQFHGQTKINESITVTVDTLDALIARHAALLGDRIYLKLDTQGFDLEALKGLKAALPKVVALQTESSVRQIYKAMPNYQETIRFVEALGYTISQIFPNNEGHFPLLVEFDCHFVRVPTSASV